jgi:hypothetical protein
VLCTFPGDYLRLAANTAAICRRFSRRPSATRRKFQREIWRRLDGNVSLPPMGAEISSAAQLVAAVF